MCRSWVPPIAPRREQWSMTAQAGSASSFATQRAAIRRHVRSLRQSLNSKQRHHAAEQVASHLLRLGYLATGKRLGVYMALPEELDLSMTIALARQHYCQLFIPRIVNMRRRQMTFTPFTPEVQLRHNRWRIAEPVTRTQPIAPAHLDAILMPLVAFDSAGHRLGMGGGFYDRYCARRQWQGWKRPKLIGIAHALQQVNALPHAPHDIAMDCVITERGIVNVIHAD